MHDIRADPVSVTLTLIQGHIGSAVENNSFKLWHSSCEWHIVYNYNPRVLLEAGGEGRLRKDEAVNC